MRQFFNQTKNIVLRKETLNDNNLSSYSDVDSFSGYLKPMSRQESSVNGIQYGKSYLLMTPDTVDIQAGDKVLIPDVGEMSVQATTLQDRHIGSIKYKESVLVLGT